MKKRMMMIACMMMAIYNMVLAEDKLTISDFKIAVGETKDVEISLANEADYVAFQFDVYLPDGITIESYSSTNRIPESTTLDMKQLSDGAYRFIAFAISGESLMGVSGSIMTIRVKASDNLAYGEKTGFLRKAKLSKADATGPTYAEFSFPITVVQPSVVTVKSISRVYGEANPTFEYTVTGGALEGEPSITCEAGPTSAVGDYAIKIAKGSVANYNVTWVDGTLTITKAPLTVGAKDETITEGDAIPMFTLTYDGFRNNDNEATAFTKKPQAKTTATASSPAGTYPITVNGGNAKNYELSYEQGTLTVGYVKLNKAEAALEKGKTITLTATAYPSSLTDKTVTWTSSDTKIATVSTDGKVKGVKAGTATITCTSNATGLKAMCTVIVGYVELDKTEAFIEKDKTLTLTATLAPSDLTDQSITWESSDTQIATVSTDGKVKGVKAGTATITCTSNATGLKATCTVIVGYVELDKTEAFIEKDKTLTLTATLAPSDLTDQSITWESSDTQIVTVSTDGKVKGVKAGTAIITCTSNATGLKATCTVIVGYVKLEKTEVNLEKGKTVTLKATVYPSSLSDRSVTWESSDTKIATVSSAGKVKGVKAGKATITATSKVTGLKTTCTVTVGYVKLDQTEAVIEKGKTVTLKATVYPSSLSDKTVTWKSSDTKIATVTAGKVKGVKAGTATITCTSKATGLKATCKVTVGYVKLDKTEVVVEKGKTLTLTATAYPSSLTDKSVTWKSSNTKIATVSSAGKVKGVKAGTATITCTSKATGLKTTCTVTVGYVKLDQTKATLLKGKTVTLKATVYPSSLADKSVTWKSSDKAVATVTSAGKVKGVKAGTATITCTSKATGLKTTCTVTVENGKVTLNKTEVRVQKGKTVTLKATVTPTSLKDKSVTWKSSNTKIATVTADGKVKGIKAGTATITCTSNATGKKATCTVTVLQSMVSLPFNGDEMLEDLETENPGIEEPFDVYDLNGRMVKSQVTSLDGLPRGIYIINGKKVMKQ